MKMPRSVIYITIVIVILMLGNFSFTQAQGIPNPSKSNLITSHANLPWASQYVQQELIPPRDVGGYVSVAISSFNDFLVMSYYNATNHSLMLASPIPARAGNCGTNNNWECVTLDGGIGLAVGMYSSMDIWGTSLDDWKMGISYYDLTHLALKSAIYTCYLGACGWDIVTIDSPALPYISVGQYSSFKFDSLGNASVAYFRNTSTGSTLTYTHQVTSSGNCGQGGAAGLWDCQEISILTSGGQFSSLDMSFDDIPYIAYYDVHEGDLRLAFHKTGIHLCDGGIDWTCLNLDGYDGSDVGLYTSIIAPQYSGDVYRVAYYDKTNGHLKYYDPIWIALMVDDMGASISPMGISMVMDKDGNPVIAYQQISSDFSPPKLNIARPYTEFPDEPYGNCGDTPPGYLYAYWLCSTLDLGDQYSDEADFASMVVNSKGMVFIAYSEYNSFYDASSLKFTFQTLWHTYLPLARK